MDLSRIFFGLFFLLPQYKLRESDSGRIDERKRRLAYVSVITQETRTPSFYRPESMTSSTHHKTLGVEVVKVFTVDETPGREKPVLKVNPGRSPDPPPPRSPSTSNSPTPPSLSHGPSLFSNHVARSFPNYIPSSPRPFPLPLRLPLYTTSGGSIGYPVYNSFRSLPQTGSECSPRLSPGRLSGSNHPPNRTPIPLFPMKLYPSFRPTLFPMSNPCSRSKTDPVQVPTYHQFSPLVLLFCRYGSTFHLRGSTVEDSSVD